MVKAFLKFTGYILLKWICFYIYQFIESGFKVKWNHTTDFEGRFLEAIMLFILPLLEIIILFFPFQIALKQKGRVMIFMHK